MSTNTTPNGAALILLRAVMAADADLKNQFPVLKFPKGTFPYPTKVYASRDRWKRLVSTVTSELCLIEICKIFLQEIPTRDDHFMNMAEDGALQVIVIDTICDRTGSVNAMIMGRYSNSENGKKHGEIFIL